MYSPVSGCKSTCLARFRDAFCRPMPELVESVIAWGGDEVDEEAVGSGDGFGELAVEGEGAVGPAAFADAGR